MKKNSSGLLIVGLIVLAIVLVFTMMWGSSGSVSPYSNKKGLNGSSLEGFHGMKPHQYASYPNNSAIDSKDRFLINDTTEQPTAQRVWGFDGLYGPASLDDSHVDVYSTASGSLDCATNSSNLTNSKGPLCLNAEQIKLLRTRGGNQTGTPCQIGGSYA